ncbi:hypothetical protein ACIRXL_08630 [Avibacterium paragallinarum]
MGKHYSTELKLQTISLVSEQGMSVRQVVEYCGLSNQTQIVIWLQRV